MNKFDPPIKAVIFDLGDTLMLPKGSWPEVFQNAAAAMEDYLFAKQVLPPNSEFRVLYLHALNQYYSNREMANTETGTLNLLTGLLTKAGISNLEKKTIMTALDKFYQVTRKNWQADPTALSTIEGLRQQGYSIGMISNAANETDVLTLLRNFKLRPYFDFVITSYATGYRKPHPAIFAKVSEHWTIPANQILMVGDRPDTDILGGRVNGMRTAWLNRYNQRNKTPGAIPDLELSSLPDLLNCLN